MLNLKKIYSTILLLTWSVFLIGRDLPPPTRDAGQPCMPMDANCDGVPIDDYLPLFFFIGMILGVWLINIHNTRREIVTK